MKTLLTILILFATTDFISAQDWDANDDTFDPKITSVVIGDRSWIGDPSPFEFMEIERTGYTHVNAAQWQGHPPAVQISLMVPVKIGETKAHGGMVMLTVDQTTELIKVFEQTIEAEADEKTEPVTLKTQLEHMEWTLTAVNEDGKRFLQLACKSKDKVDKFRFTINAAKKLTQAIQHAHQTLKADEKKAETDQKSKESDKSKK